MSAPSMKLVYDFGDIVLCCGSETTHGYTHIKRQHKAQFAALAGAVGRTWEDLLWFSIAWADHDPDATRFNPANGKACASRILHLANSQGLVVSSLTYKTIYIAGTGQVITSFPTGSQCRNQDVGLSGAEPMTTTR